MNRLSVFFAVLIASVASPAGTATPDPLEIGFRFATAIEVDPNDQAMAQEGIVDDLIALGRLEEAGQRADRIKGWRRGTAYADIARALALAGKADEARGFLARADEVKRQTSDWGAPRIAAHSAEALAVLGDVEKTTAIATELIKDNPRQYTGRSAASLSSGLAHKGDFTGAMARLDALKDAKDFDTTWWRTTGYLDLAGGSSFTAAQRRQAIEAARRSAEGIAGFKRGEALIDIGREFSRQGSADAAREALTVAEKIITPLPATQPDKAHLMSQLATVWGGVGDKTRARKLLKRAESEAPSAPVIDRPAGLARIGGALWALGDHEASNKLFDRALAGAGELVNARPRALAVVEICRSLGRDAVVVGPEFQARLDSLFAGLKDPW